MKRIGVLQMIDTLDIGGAERMAVNIANRLPQDHFASYLCTTRREGVLLGAIEDRVGCLSLTRRRRIDIRAVKTLVRFIEQKQISILHAHGPALFLAVLTSLLVPKVSVIWHHHHGRCALENLSAGVYRWLALRTQGVIAVSEPLAEWTRQQLPLRKECVWYVPNFAVPSRQSADSPVLSGEPNARIVCVANLHGDKDQVNLIQAMSRVVQQVPNAHVVLVGSLQDEVYVRQVEQKITELNLAAACTLLGVRENVEPILRSCTVGVLSSASEGLPLALIEYGMAGLPAISTRVGQCAEVLDNGAAGILVPPKNPEALANALIALLQSPQRQTMMAERFAQRVQQNYSAEAVIGQICACYAHVLNKGGQT